MEQTTQQDGLITALSNIDQSALWASWLWGAVASGYCVYGWKQKSIIPWLGGFAMTAACFMSSALIKPSGCVVCSIHAHYAPALRHKATIGFCKSPW